MSQNFCDKLTKIILSSKCPNYWNFFVVAVFCLFLFFASFLFCFIFFFLLCFLFWSPDKPARMLSTLPKKSELLNLRVELLDLALYKTPILTILNQFDVNTNSGLFTDIWVNGYVLYLLSPHPPPPPPMLVRLHPCPRFSCRAQVCHLWLIRFGRVPDLDFFIFFKDLLIIKSYVKFHIYTHFYVVIFSKIGPKEFDASKFAAANAKVSMYLCQKSVSTITVRILLSSFSSIAYILQILTNFFFYFVTHLDDEES